MSANMTDEEFLSYCQGMTHTERCGFVPEQIARLFALAGEQDQAEYWAAQPLRIIDHCHDEIADLVKKGCARLDAGASA